MGPQREHRLHLAILVGGMQHHVSPTNWPPLDDYKFEPLNYLLTQTMQNDDVTRNFYQNVINRARNYQNPIFTRSMLPAVRKKVFVRMLGFEIAVRNQFKSSRGIVEAAVLLQRRYLDNVRRQSASGWGLYVWPVSKQKLHEMRGRKTTTVSTPKAAPRIYDIVGWLENDETSPRVELYQDFHVDDCIYVDYRLDQMKINWVNWRDYMCNEQGKEAMLDEFSVVNWFNHRSSSC
ncbi:uncharacterized protein MYCFIDRAFT_212055 [Pseudocercospora fijiensis CIRAD86]|uniref:Uncharacterized protein n=1 Tax=Pseudocercospora fijiensis (strain CIRAD86) TaxID=383855 RepID=M3ATE5_PSEFD|nr:uncharacterized protein MYCFIDRAFT_212055 [Pseudocercospora fijiensis CIRAD86]EME80418.1 hypothetical protein MYCFIDRAFT_212055 [Pseudocercospora fijiensis CIRAD86]